MGQMRPPPPPPLCRISDTEQSPLLHSPNLIIYTYLAPRGPLCPLFARFPRTGINTRRFLHGSCTVARLPRKDTHIYIYIYSVVWRACEGSRISYLGLRSAV